MRQLKVETLSIRTSADIKQLLKLAAAKERRSVASMIEVLILAYAQEYGLKVPAEAERNIDKPEDKYGTD